MSLMNPSRIGMALPALLISQAAFADVTPAEVWGDWKQYLEGTGYTLTGTETANGDDLSVTDITLTLPLPEDAGEMNMTLGAVTFTQNGDGTVAVTFPDEMPMSMTVQPSQPGAEQVAMSFVYSQSGQQMTVSGSADEMTTTYAAETIALQLTEFVVDGESFGEDNAKIRVNASGVSSNTVMKAGELRGYSQSGAFASLAYDIAFDNPEEDADVAITGTMSDLAFDGDSTVPMNLTPGADLAAMLRAGFAGNGTISYGGGSMQVNAESELDGSFGATSTTSGGKIDVEMSGNKLAYSGEQSNIEVTVQAADLPFPVQFSMAKGAFNLGMPVAPSDDAQDFAFGITLGDFVMSDLIWSIFDPTAQLPRDPATIKLDLSGKAKMLVDIFDPTATAALGGQPPAELNEIDVNEVLVSAAGAKLQGNGAVAFDNTDVSTFPGMPKPVGEVNLSLAGANGLLDKLVGMGLLPEEQAMGARMMMGLFAVPGDAPDTLSSKVEFTEEGQVLANGQRLR